MFEYLNGVFDATQLTEAVSPLNHLGRKVIFGLYGAAPHNYLKY